MTYFFINILLHMYIYTYVDTYKTQRGFGILTMCRRNKSKPWI